MRAIIKGTRVTSAAGHTKPMKNMSNESKMKAPAEKMQTRKKGRK